MVYTLINNKELVEEMCNILVGGASCRLPAQQGCHAIMGKFLLVANPGYVVYNIYDIITTTCTIGSLIFKGTTSGVFQIYHGKSHDSH